MLFGKKNTENQKNINSSFAAAGPYLNIGYFFMASMFIFGFVGHLIDKKYQFNSIFLLAGLFVGLIFGFYNMYKVISQMEKKSK